MTYTQTRNQVFLALEVPNNEYKGIAFSQAINEIGITDPLLNNLTLNSFSLEGFGAYNSSAYTVICQIGTPVTVEETMLAKSKK